MMMTVSLGLRIIGVILALAGISSFTNARPLGEPDGLADAITALIMFGLGCGLFFWGFRRRQADKKPRL
jgi:nitrogen fixation-related uncharacterized protein